MKQKIFYPILIIVLIISTAPSCKKTNTKDQLPPETHVGAFTFGCKVDGKIYTASGKMGGFAGFLNPNQYVNYAFRPLDSIIEISAQNSSTSINVSFDFTFQYLDSLGTYKMKQYAGSFFDGKNSYYTTNIYTGSITIKYFNGSFYPINLGTILAGTFEMDAINSDGKVIHITEGRFDIGK